MDTPLAADFPAGQENDIEFYEAQPPIYRVVNAVPHAEVEGDRRELGGGKTARDVWREARQEAVYGVAHGG